MRIGTWNLDGRWDQRHLALVDAMACDVLLLTEVPNTILIPGMSIHASSGYMATGRHWAAIASREHHDPLPDPHGASAMAEVAGLRFCSSILPWRSCAPIWPEVGTSTTERTVLAVSAVEHAAPHVWGGDWNHALSGPEWVGSHAGRAALLAVVRRLGLVVATADAPHRKAGGLSIDHIAVPETWKIRERAEHYVATARGARLSDHDAYVIERE